MPIVFLEIVSDDFSILQALGSACFGLLRANEEMILNGAMTRAMLTTGHQSLNQGPIP
jgi:hypothetical protein